MRKIDKNSNRIKIKSIRIRNFRSLRNVKIDVKNMNIFVGNNDVGKSNVLKALNLFFNGMTDCDVGLNFLTDFSKQFPDKSHEAKEIKIEIEFDVPKAFKDNGVYVWRKTWRGNKIDKDGIRREGNQKIGRRSKVITTLREIRFRYVPAVKSKEYFKVLLSDLYETLSLSLNKPIKKSVETFAKELKTRTGVITKNIDNILQIKSELTVPDDLNEIFRSLIFETKDNERSAKVSLFNRGDGIQARHIPVVLKYIADEDQYTRNQGKTRISTIWGFEEPENGVELAMAFRMANEFLKYSEDVQIFLTSHSPAFYMKKSNEEVKVFFVNRDSDSLSTDVFSEDSKTIAKNMGLMPIVAPYIEEKQKQIDKLLKIVSYNTLMDIDTIFVEGRSDKIYLEMAIKELSPVMLAMLKNNELRIFSKEGEGGTTSLYNWAMAWLYSGYKSKAFVLFDKDARGVENKNKIVSDEVYSDKKYNTGRLRVKCIEPSQVIANLDISFSVEDLLSLDILKEAKKHNLLKNCGIQKFNNLVLSYEQSAKEYVEKLNVSQEVKDLILTSQVKDTKKIVLAEQVKMYVEKGEFKNAFEGFKRTIENLERYFSKQEG